MNPNGNCVKPGRFFPSLNRLLIPALFFAAITPAWAERGADRGADNEFNFSWLDTDKKIYVLQNRRYLKANHILLSGMLGVGMSNPYRDVLGFDPRIAYYWSEAFGIEVFYSIFSNSPNATSKALSQTIPNASPVTRDLKSQLGGLLHWAPWYAKINVFNQILYFDWYFTAGLGQMTMSTRPSSGATFTETPIAFLLGTGHQYHVSQDWVVRLDLTSSIYSGKILGNSGENAFFSNFNFVAGLGYRL
ncbi:MAG: outer membrane beta-barrel domain-containing protein [Bdellovibrionales bacterium]|nr:outer membrane beta-barrel domain-containing protein [Bdellovibrionales bacterium]